MKFFLNTFSFWIWYEFQFFVIVLNLFIFRMARFSIHFSSNGAFIIFCVSSNCSIFSAKALINAVKKTPKSIFLSFRDKIFVKKSKLRVKAWHLLKERESLLIVRMHLCVSFWIFKETEIWTSWAMIGDYFKKNNSIFADWMQRLNVACCKAIKQINANQPFH